MREYNFQKEREKVLQKYPHLEMAISTFGANVPNPSFDEIVQTLRFYVENLSASNALFSFMHDDPNLIPVIFHADSAVFRAAGKLIHDGQASADYVGDLYATLSNEMFRWPMPPDLMLKAIRTMGSYAFETYRHMPPDPVLVEISHPYAEVATREALNRRPYTKELRWVSQPPMKFDFNAMAESKWLHWEELFVWVWALLFMGRHLNYLQKA